MKLTGTITLDVDDAAFPITNLINVEHELRHLTHMLRKAIHHGAITVELNVEKMDGPEGESLWSHDVTVYPEPEKETPT